MKIGEVCPSNNCGDVEVIEYVNALKVKVRFLGTGTEASFQASAIRDGRIKDYNKPNLYGVGYLGYGSHRSKIKGKRNPLYDIWVNMLSRCYDKNNKCYYSYGAKGVIVCDEWHNFQNFAKWYEDNYPKDGKKYDLDKDFLSGDCKIYSSETCCFLTHKENSILAKGKHYTMINPEGEIVEIYNMNQFCRENNLQQSHMIRVHNGRRLHHKGWTKA